MGPEYINKVMLNTVIQVDLSWLMLYLTCQKCYMLQFVFCFYSSVVTLELYNYKTSILKQNLCFQLFMIC